MDNPGDENDGGKNKERHTKSCQEEVAFKAFVSSHDLNQQQHT